MTLKQKINSIKYFTIFFVSKSGYPLLFVLNRFTHLSDIPYCNSGNGIFITIKPSRIALEMPDILRCMSSSW